MIVEHDFSTIDFLAFLFCLFSKFFCLLSRFLRSISASLSALRTLKLPMKTIKKSKIYKLLIICNAKISLP